MGNPSIKRYETATILVKSHGPLPFLTISPIPTPYNVESVWSNIVWGEGGQVLKKDPLSWSTKRRWWKQQIFKVYHIHFDQDCTYFSWHRPEYFRVVRSSLRTSGTHSSAGSKLIDWVSKISTQPPRFDTMTIWQNNGAEEGEWWQITHNHSPSPPPAP